MAMGWDEKPASHSIDFDDCRGRIVSILEWNSRAKRFTNLPKLKEITTKASEPKKVDAYIAKLKHPLASVVKNL